MFQYGKLIKLSCDEELQLTLKDTSLSGFVCYSCILLAHDLFVR